MEGFWDILKRERYYGRRFTSKQDLIQMIERYIRYYPHQTSATQFRVMTPWKSTDSLAAWGSGQQFTLLVGKILFFPKGNFFTVLLTGSGLGSQIYGCPFCFLYASGV